MKYLNIINPQPKTAEELIEEMKSGICNASRAPTIVEVYDLPRGRKLRELSKNYFIVKDLKFKHLKNHINLRNIADFVDLARAYPKHEKLFLYYLCNYIAGEDFDICYEKACDRILDFYFKGEI